MIPAEINEKIRTLIERPILREPVDWSFRLQTPVQWYLGQPSAWRLHPDRRSVYFDGDLGPRRQEILRIFNRGFGHTAANPSVPGNVRALSQLYAFPDTPPEAPWHAYGVDRCPCPNATPDEPLNFLNDLVKIAKENREVIEMRYLGQHDPAIDLSTIDVDIGSRSKWVLLGDRGIGKTIFLNYLFSCNNKFLTEQKVIWIRIDYTKAAPEDVSLEDWFHWQFCHVLFKYYDLEEQAADIVRKKGSSPEILAHWRYKHDAHMIFDFSAKNQELYERAALVDRALSRTKFNDYISSEKTDIRSTETPRIIKHKWLFRAIWDYLNLDEKVSFIFIVDGLDRLGLTDQDEKEFERKIKDLAATILPESAPQCAYLITMRHDSFRHHFVNGQFRRQFQPAVMAEVPGVAIWNKKKMYMCDSHSFIFSEDGRPRKILSEAYRALMADVCDTFLKFCTLCLTTSLPDTTPTEDVEVGFSYLEGIFGSDRRRMFTALANVGEFFVKRLPRDFDIMLDHCFAGEQSEFIRAIEGVSYTPRTQAYRDLKKWYYLFVEGLLLGKFGVDFVKPRDARYGKSELAAQTITLQPYDRPHYLYNLYSFPCGRAWSFRPFVLAPIRTIQFTRYNGGIVMREDLVDFVTRHFGYPEGILSAMVDEMFEFGIFRTHAGDPAVVLGEMELTTSGCFAYDRLMSSLEYLALALQGAALPSQLVEAKAFPVRPYQSREFVVDNKIVASVNFVRLIGQIERNEERIFNEQARKGSGFSSGEYTFQKYKGQNFSIFPMIAENISRAIGRIIFSAYANRRDEFIQQIEGRISDDSCWVFDG